MNIGLISTIVLFGTLSIAMWDEDNGWKRVTLFIVALVASIALVTTNYHEGYHKGYDSGRCFVYNSLDKQESVSIENKPEVCK